MAGWVRSALACLAFGAAAVFAADTHMAGELLEPVSRRAVAPSAAAGAAGVDEQLEALRLQLEVLRSDLDTVRRRDAGLCDFVMKQTNVTSTRSVYCSARQISGSIMKSCVLSSAAFWLCLPLFMLKRALWYLQYLPLNMDGAMVEHLGVFLEAVVAANICFNADEVLPAMVPQGPRDWILSNPVWVIIFMSVTSATMRILWACLAAPRGSGSRRWSAASADSHHGSHFVVSNRYQDLTFAPSNVMMLFIVQISLLLFYFVHLHESTSQYFTTDEKASFFQWFVGCCVIWYTGADEMGAGFNGAYWEYVVSEVKQDGAPASKRMEVWVRSCMSFIVNSVGVTFIRSTFPIILATSGPWGFIADCMMIFYVTTLDDIKQDRDFAVDNIKRFLGKSGGDGAESTGTMSTDSDIDCANGAEEGEALKCG